MEFSEIIHARRSVKCYDPSERISDATLHAIFEDVILSPSSYNLQHWHFIAVRNPEVKKQLRQAAWGQPQVEEAAVTILVLGKLNAHEDAPRIYADAPDDVRARLVPMIAGFYDHNPQKQHDEALRSGSLAAMALMLAARARGFDTGPMIGFDPEAVCKILGVPGNYIPVMMIVLGTCVEPPRPRDYRKPVSEVVSLDAMDGMGLAAE
jgi:nitroreductase